MMFLQMAFAAQQANKARIEAMKRAKRKNAETGGSCEATVPRTAFCERSRSMTRATDARSRSFPICASSMGSDAWENASHLPTLPCGRVDAGHRRPLFREGVPTARAINGHATRRATGSPSTVMYMSETP